MLTKYEKYLHLVWYVVVVLTLLVSVGSMVFGRLHYAIDLSSHFQLQYTLWGICLLLMGEVIQINRRILLTGIIYIVIFAIFWLLPLTLRADTPLKNSDNTIFYINSEFNNLDTNPIIEQITATNPDTVALVEANEQIIAQLTEIYGPPIEKDGSGSYSCVIFSRKENETIDISDRRLEYPVCTVEIESVKLVLIHPHPPLTQAYYESQKVYFNQVFGIIIDYEISHEDYILLGDFNSTLYSPIFREYFGFLHRTNIYTWSVGELISIPIDHALSRMNLEVSRMPRSTSDHAALVIEY